MPKEAKKAAPVVNDTAALALGFLARADGAVTGGDIMAAAVQVEGFFNVTRSQLYRELHKLADDGLIKAGKRGPRGSTPYRITAAGRKEGARWMKAKGGVVIRDSVKLREFFTNNVQR